MKHCSKCKKTKKISEYYKSVSRYDGLQSCCIECQKKWQKNWELKNREHRREYKQRYGRFNRDRINQCKTIVRNKYPDRYRQYVINYRIRGGDNYKKRVAEYQRDRRDTDVNFCIAGRLRSRITSALKREYKKADSVISLLGCSLDKLRLHLINQFTDGMTWKKFMNAEIHMDHIKPCASFDLSKPEEQKKCFNYTNVQPLWAEDNRKKSNRIAL